MINPWQPMTWIVAAPGGEPMVDCVTCGAQLPEPVDNGLGGVQVCDKCGAEQPTLTLIPDDYASTSTAVGKCNRCERFTWAESEIDTEDRMPQPDGNPCGGHIAKLRTDDPHDRLARVVREVLRDSFANPDDQADAIVAAIMTEQREHIAPLADRMLQAADTIEELNALQGMRLNTLARPSYLRSEGYQMGGQTECRVYSMGTDGDCD